MAETGLTPMAENMLSDLIRKEFDRTYDTDKLRCLIECAKQLRFNDLSFEMQKDLDFEIEKIK
jgi:hypothetical protein